MDYFIRYLKKDLKFFKVSYGIYGLGRCMLHLICHVSGIHPLIKANKINVNSISYSRILEFLVSSQSSFGEPLKREVFTNIKKLIDNRTYRGTRHKHGYPSNGQRTHTNAKTKKKLFNIYINMYSSKADNFALNKSKNIKKPVR